MIRRASVSCAGVALAVSLFLTPAVLHAQGRGGQPVQPGQQGGLRALQARVQALEARVIALDAALHALGVDLQETMDVLSADVAVLRGEIGTLTVDMSTLTTRVAALEAAVADLGGGLTSYDALAGLPCTTAVGGAGTVNLVGFLKSPVCAAGISANGRFFDLGPVVLDTQTGLLWEKKTTAVGSGADLHDVDNTYSWCQATGNSTGFCSGNATSWIGQVNAGVFAGFSNWRVPTRDELLSIVDMGCCIDPIFDPRSALSIYWSSTEFDSNLAWVVTDGSSVATKSSEFSVRAVRAGP